MAGAFPKWMAVIALILFLLAAEALLRFRDSEVQSQLRLASVAFASELRARVDRELNSVLYLSSGVVGYLSVRYNRLDPDEIRQILAAVHARGEHVRNFSIAVGYHIDYVYPIEGNEAVLGRDCRDITDQWPAVQAAIASNQGVLTGPVRLLQGGSALIYRIPIRVAGQYWGLLSTVIDMSSFTDAAFKGLDNARFEFAIRTRESGGRNEVFMGEPSMFLDPSAILLQAPIPNGEWVFAVKMRTQGNPVLPWVLRSVAWILSVLAALGVYTVFRQRSELAHQVGVDPLTGLPNRRLFDDRLDQSIRRQARNSEGGSLAMLFLDLDGFKAINDRYGHKFGDAVLRRVASRIRKEIRLGDTVSRWAGDEFAIIAEDFGGEQITQLDQRLRRCIARPMDIEGIAINVGVSIGVAFCPGEAVSAHDLLALADQRMFEDKARRKRQ